MSKVYVISDTHFGHSKTWEVFKHPNGVDPMRPFTSTQEMDEVMVHNWNDTVSDKDTVIHMGDFCLNEKYLNTVRRLNRNKLILLLGNHDTFSTQKYLDAGFDEVYASYTMKKIGVVCTHIPIHPSQLEYRFKWNWHGHTHCHVIKDKWDKPDPRYVNLCVEYTNYTPISVDEVVEKYMHV